MYDVCVCGCVCVCGSVAGGASGGALSVITISDWVRAKVCDISQPSTRGAAVEAHLRVTLSRRSSLPLLHRDSRLRVTHAGRVWMAAAV